MPTNDFLPVASAGGANVMSQADYAIEAARLAGVVAGTAKSSLANKSWRQSAAWAAALGQFLNDYGGFDALDDGNTANLKVALARIVQTGLNYVVATGTANAWTVGPSLAPAAYAAGLPFDIVAPATNTNTSVTANISAIGTKSIKRSDGADPQVGDLVSGTLYRTVYDGTNIRISGQLPSQARAASFKTTRVVFSTPGSISWTVPAGVTRVRIRTWGGGGGGGYGATGSPGGGAAGGGGGAYWESAFDVAPGDSITGTVGSAGGAGFSGQNGFSGGNSTVTVAATTYTAGGGAGGTNAAGGAVTNSAAGGTITGTVDRSFIGEPSGGGLLTGASTVGGKGGSSPQGGLGGLAGTGNANAGISPGGGGGGSANAGTAGAGARGEVWIEY